MKTQLVVTSDTENMLKGFNPFGYWDSEKKEWIEITENFDSIRNASNVLGISENAVESIRMSFEILMNSLRESLISDLEDIWKKVDK